jgi:light-regulated signal transduction histidine kinase (bacteriophytochrome)
MLIGLALANLISNGLKFNRSERPTVEIGVAPSQQPTVYVRDNGIGIDPRHHEVVFTMFRRLHGRQEYEGSGAGLTIVRKIAESLGGRVWLESEPAKGATFYLALPPAITSTPLAPPHWSQGPVRCEIPA